MKKILLLIIITSLVGSLTAQTPYFQQEVNNKIEVTLDDEKHTLSGNIEIEYINNAPEALNEIYFHLWPNAYKSRQTAFSKQQLKNKSTKFYFAEDKKYGGLSELDFKVNGQVVTWELDEKTPDIALLKLDQPLASGGKIIITTPFILDIPSSFSRLGHVGQSYQMTQWYPKPAVYDRDGWHPMPYLDMGEFYSEFGRFDVKITLPENYVVGATGVLQNESEQAFLLEKAEASKKILAAMDEPPALDSFPSSSAQTKTIHYIAEQVHDFAWFADKRFYVQKSAVTLADGKQVDTWTMFTNAEADLWKKSIDYVNRAVAFYSETVGAYPYPHATAVQSALSAGGGMEYPMITVIGLSGDAQSLDAVITHEVGHNWFYGILAFDERDHPWLDEGLNSYYDHRYSSRYYENSDMEILPPFLTKTTSYPMLDLVYLFQARRNLDQAPETSSADFKPINYFLSAYEKPARIFRYLEKYLGTQELDRIMQSFYQKWAFKHPQPEDLRQHLETESQKDLNWLFDGLLFSNKKIDYAFQGLKKTAEGYQLKIKNKGSIASPFPVSAYQGDQVVHTEWYEGFEGQKELDFYPGDYDAIVIDDQSYSLDVDRRNNRIKTKGGFKKMEPLRLHFLTGIETPERTNLYWLPLLTWNNYDKTMLGLALYNTTIPAQNFEFALAPQFSIVTKQLNGIANIKYHLFPKTKALQKVTFDLGWKSYNASYNARNDYYLKYHRIAPVLKFVFGKKRANSNFTHSISLRNLLLYEERAQFSSEGNYTGNKTQNSWIKQLVYSAENRTALHPFRIEFHLEQQNYEAFVGNENYLKASLEANFAYTYKRGRNIDFRFFVGKFLNNSRRNAGNVSNDNTRASFALTSQGYNDYRYDEFYAGRSDPSDIWSHQISLREGGMKNAFGSAFGIGQSNDGIIALNIKADLPQNLPFDLPLKPYFDLGYFNNATPLGNGASLNDQVLWSGGLMLDFFDGTLGFYFPLVNSKNMDIPYAERSNGKYLGKITFSLDLHRLNPWNLVDRIEF